MSIDRVKTATLSLRPSTARRRMGLVTMLLVGAGFASVSGCTAMTGMNNAWQYNGYWNESMMGFRNSSYASKAWHSRKHCFTNQQYLKDFHRGFKAGYNEVAGGGKGCTPMFPPREYWGWKYQSNEGQARVAAWFAGFPHGARAAEEDGIGQWHQIQTSSKIQQEYVDHGLMPSEHNGMYPVPRTDIPAGVQRSPATNMPGMPNVMETEVIETEVIPMQPPQFPTPNGIGL
jgi:hypothetical protein